MKNLIYGIRPLIEAINSGQEIEKILIQKGLTGSLFHELRDALKGRDIPAQYVPIEKLNRLTGKNHQGVVAFISLILYQPLEELITMIYERGKMPFVLILDKITDVRNFGAIVRTAECAGVDLIIIPEKGSAQINADAMKTSAGALNVLPVHRSKNLKLALEYLYESGIKIISCTEKATDDFQSVNYQIPLAIIMGSEEDGISGEYLKRSDFLVKIPLLGTISSLNVSVATGVILYEVVKQRQGD